MRLIGPNPQLDPEPPPAEKQLLLVGTPVWHTSGTLAHPDSKQMIISITIIIMPVTSGCSRSLLRRMIILLIIAGKKIRLTEIL